MYHSERYLYFLYLLLHSEEVAYFPWRERFRVCLLQSRDIWKRDQCCCCRERKLLGELHEVKQKAYLKSLRRFQEETAKQSLVFLSIVLQTHSLQLLDSPCSDYHLLFHFIHHPIILHSFQSSHFHETFFQQSQYSSQTLDSQGMP